MISNEKLEYLGDQFQEQGGVAKLGISFDRYLGNYILSRDCLLFELQFAPREPRPVYRPLIQIFEGSIND